MSTAVHQPPAKREGQLDALRGLAALVVVFHHWALVVPDVREQIAGWMVPRLLIAGPQAVVIFFVLSGFVLFEAYERYHRAGLIAWWGWRAVRLTVPMAACVTISALLALAVGRAPVAGMSSWFNTESWASPVTMWEWLRNFLPLDGRQNHQLDNPTWSLTHEVRLSLLFPLLALAVKRSWAVTVAATLAIAMVTPGFPSSQVDLLWTARYLLLFAAGAALASNRAKLTMIFEQLRGDFATAILLFIAMVAIVSDSGLDLAPGLLVSAGAVLLVAICVFQAEVAAALSRPLLIGLGRISYSLYLVHLPVLLASVHLLHDVLPVAAIAAGAIPFTIFMAILLERWVDRPAQRLARRFLTGSLREREVSPETLETVPEWRQVSPLSDTSPHFFRPR